MIKMVHSTERDQIKNINGWYLNSCNKNFVMIFLMHWYRAESSCKFAFKFPTINNFIAPQRLIRRIALNIFWMEVEILRKVIILSRTSKKNCALSSCK